MASFRDPRYRTWQSCSLQRNHCDSASHVPLLMTSFVAQSHLIPLHGQRPEQTRAEPSYCAPLVLGQYSQEYRGYCT
jgi:hypothetical protein